MCHKVLEEKVRPKGNKAYKIRKQCSNRDKGRSDLEYVCNFSIFISSQTP